MTTMATNIPLREGGAGGIVRGIEGARCTPGGTIASGSVIGPDGAVPGEEGG
jgi:hypothetical protein